MMIDYTLDQTKSVLHVRPTGPLQEKDFVALSQAVDPFIERNRGLSGLLLEVAHFPGWTNLAAATQHFRFVRDHHRRIKKIAIVADSLLGEAVEQIATHFVAATIKHFSFSHLDDAKTWVAST
jgi:hypothetical protein